MSYDYYFEDQADLIESFRRWLEMGHSPRTAETYTNIIRKYLTYYGEAIPPILEPLEEAEVAIEFIQKYSNKPRSMAVAAYAIKALYEFLGRPDIASRIPSVRGGGWTPSVIPLDPRTIRMAIEMMPKARDRAVLCTALDLALRRSEVTLLKRSEFNPSTCEIIVHRLKGPKGMDRQHLLSLSDWCCNMVKEYLATRNDDCDCLFASVSKDKVSPVNRETVRRIFKRFANVIGLPELRFHQIRHTRITELARVNPNILELANFAGHRNPQSTMIYIHLARTGGGRSGSSTHD